MSAGNNSARKGKVARLPYEVRESINQMIRDGATARQLNAHLKTLKLGPFNGANWSNWRHGGYKDWLMEQKRLDEIRDRHETIRRELEAGGFSVLDKAIYQVANDLSDADLDPIKVAGAISALKSAVTGSKRAETYERRAQLAEEALELEREKFAAAQARADQADKAEGVVRDRSLTPEEKDRKYKEIFGIA